MSSGHDEAFCANLNISRPNYLVYVNTLLYVESCYVLCRLLTKPLGFTASAVIIVSLDSSLLSLPVRYLSSGLHLLLLYVRVTKPLHCQKWDVKVIAAVMVVGALIFVLGIDLVKEAIWDNRHRVTWSVVFFHESMAH